MAFDGKMYDNIYEAESHTVPLYTARNCILINSAVVYISRVVEAKAFGWVTCIIFNTSIFYNKIAQTYLEIHILQH